MATNEFNDYTELIHAGEGIEIEKGKISATGGSGGGGLTLYGPYTATNEDTAIISPQTAGGLFLNIIMDDEGNLLEYPSDSEIVPIFLLKEFDTPNSIVAVSSVYLPYLDGGEWGPASMEVRNVSNTVDTIPALSSSIVFYSSVEFPLAD